MHRCKTSGVMPQDRPQWREGTGSCPYQESRLVKSGRSEPEPGTYALTPPTPFSSVDNLQFYFARPRSLLYHHNDRESAE